MKVFFAAMAVMLSMSVLNSCGSKKSAATALVAETKTEAGCTCYQRDSTACCGEGDATPDSTKFCCQDKAE